jgi:hypothetical protein
MKRKKTALVLTEQINTYKEFLVLARDQGATGINGRSSTKRYVSRFKTIDIRVTHHFTTPRHSGKERSGTERNARRRAEESNEFTSIAPWSGLGNGKVKEGRRGRHNAPPVHHGRIRHHDRIIAVWSLVFIDCGQRLGESTRPSKRRNETKCAKREIKDFFREDE